MLCSYINMSIYMFGEVDEIQSTEWLRIMLQLGSINVIPVVVNLEQH